MKDTDKEEKDEFKDVGQIQLGLFSQIDGNIGTNGTNEKNERRKSLVDMRVEKYNAEKYSGKIYDCKKCGNKGLIAYNIDGTFVLKKCDCYKKRLSREKLNGMGLLQFVDKNNSFDSFLVKEEWQKIIKEKAIEFTDETYGTNGSDGTLGTERKERKDYFFYLGGAVGSGKTKICTTIFANLINDLSSEDYEYYNWDSNLRDLAFVDKDRELMTKLKNCKVLYIDDFLRQASRSGKLDTYERNLAKELIDYRYMRKLITIISSEMYYNELLKCDDAIATRIKQYGITLSVKREASRNNRLAKADDII